MMNLDPRRRRILFRAKYRGTHEADLLVGDYVSPRIAGMTAAELDELESVLLLPDTDLADFLSGRRPIPPELNTRMLQAMKKAAIR